MIFTASVLQSTLACKSWTLPDFVMIGQAESLKYFLCTVL